MNKTSPPADSFPWLRRADQACAAAVGALALGVLAANWYFHGGRRGELIEIERTERRTPEFHIDLNRAEWPELALLPDVGETLAKRILAWRDEHGPFARTEDLRRVKGMGPRTFERIRPHVFVSDP